MRLRILWVIIILIIYNNLNKIKGMSSSLKRIYNKNKNKENDKNNFKYIEKEILKKDFENEISNSHFTDIKSQKNDKFNIRTQNNTNNSKQY